MTYPQQPGNWSDPSWPSQPANGDPNQPPVYSDPNYPASGAPASPATGYPATGYPDHAGYAPQAYPAYGYGAPPPVMVARSTNGLAIASLVCALAGLATCGVTSLVGAILGHVARKQIRENGQDGDGMALAGIITGWIITGIYLVILVIYAIAIVYAIDSGNA